MFEILMGKFEQYINGKPAGPVRIVCGDNEEELMKAVQGTGVMTILEKEQTDGKEEQGPLGKASQKGSVGDGTGQPPRGYHHQGN
jgi:hypothetical protein